MHILLWSESGEWIETDKIEVLQKAYTEKSHRIWVDTNEPSPEDLKTLADLFGLHFLTVQAIRNRVDNPKIDIHDNYVFMVLHRIFYHFKTEFCELREFEVCFSDRFILTTHTNQLLRTFTVTLEKVREHRKECVLYGPSYVLYRLLNLCIQDYSPAIEEWHDALNEIEQRVLKKSKDEVMEKILDFKKLVAHMRKRLIPEKGVLQELYESRNLAYIPGPMRPFFKGLMDNMNAVFLDLESLREQATSVFEVYSTMLSHQINFVIQRLTIGATIFLPLTFIVGVYGMNFSDMPEMQMKGFYYILWAIMLALVGGMLYFFRRKKWI